MNEIESNVHQEQTALRRILRHLREGAGLTQQDLASRLAKPQSFVSKYEAGARRLDILETRRICSALGVSLAHLESRLEQILRIKK